MPKVDQKSQSSVTRTLGILEHLSNHKSINLERLAEETSLPKPTLYRFLSTLVELGYVYRDANDQYSLTLKMFSVGSKGLSHMEISQVAAPAAEELGLHVGETVHMGVLDDGSAMYILKIESRYTIRMYSRVGKRIPLYCTAIGKVLLSELPEGRLNDLVKQMEFVPFTRNTITGSKELLAQLSEIRHLGFAEDKEEHEEGICCIAVPVRDYEGTLVAGLSVSWPVFRFHHELRQEYISAIKKCADTISARLGYLAR